MAVDLHKTKVAFELRFSAQIKKEAKRLLSFVSSASSRLAEQFHVCKNFQLVSFISCSDSWFSKKNPRKRHLEANHTFFSNKKTSNKPSQTSAASHTVRLVHFWFGCVSRPGAGWRHSFAPGGPRRPRRAGGVLGRGQGRPFGQRRGTLSPRDRTCGRVSMRECVRVCAGVCAVCHVFVRVVNVEI